MRSLKLFALPAVAALCCFVPASQFAQAQVSFGISVGQAPVCPYGYFDYSPYNCAPYGYYGPEWFHDGGFIGAGPWYHGDRGWHGHIDRHYDPRYGYRGALPRRGEHGHGYRSQDFHGHDLYQGGGEMHGNDHGNMRGDQRGNMRANDRGNMRGNQQGNVGANDHGNHGGDNH